MVSIREITLSFITGIELVVRVAALIFMRSYGFTLAQTIIQEKQERAKATKLAEDLKKAIALYYQMAGWDENGVPTKGKLWELNLEWLPEAQ